MIQWEHLAGIQASQTQILVYLTNITSTTLTNCLIPIWDNYVHFILWIFFFLSERFKILSKFKSWNLGVRGMIKFIHIYKYITHPNISNENFFFFLFYVFTTVFPVCKSISRQYIQESNFISVREFHGEEGNLFSTCFLFSKTFTVKMSEFASVSSENKTVYPLRMQKS